MVKYGGTTWILGIVGLIALATFLSVFSGLAGMLIGKLSNVGSTCRDGLIGEMGVAKTDIDNHQGKVFVHGEWWNAVADGQIPAGSRIQVDTIDNLILKVKKSGG